MASDYLPTMADSTLPDPAAGTTPPVPPLPPAQPLRLVYLSGSKAGQTLELPGGTALVGRHPESAVRFDHTVDFLVSTRHGQFTFENGQWVFIDTGSTNGTWVNGSRVPRQVLSQGTTLILGTPGAPGSVSIKADFDGSATAHPIEGGDAAFAQEPPSSSDMVAFVCQNCGAVNNGLWEEVGQTVACAVCGKQTKVVPSAGGATGAGKPSTAEVPLFPAAAATASTSSYVPPVGSTPAPGSQHPPVVVPEDSGFFGGIIGNVKGAINRMRERRELARDIVILEEQLPSFEAAVQQASTALGRELWQTSSEGVSTFKSATKLAAIDVAVEQVNERRKTADAAAAEQAATHQRWTEEWEARFAGLEADLALALQTLNDAQSSLAAARQEVVSTVASRATLLSALAGRMNELSAEAQVEPKDDFASRYEVLTADLAASLGELQAPIDGWQQKIDARSAATAAVEQAILRQQEATAHRDAAKQEKATKDAEQAAATKAHQQQLQAMSAEADRIRQQATPLHAELGRQYIDAPPAQPLQLAPVSWTNARAAVDRLKQAQASVAQKKQRLAELEQ